MKYVYFICLLGMTLFASYLGLFAQSIAYFFEGLLPLMTTLVIATLLSIVLYISTFVLATILLTAENINHTMYIILLFLNNIIGFFISGWSLFVLAMWWH